MRFRRQPEPVAIADADLESVRGSPSAPMKRQKRRGVQFRREAEWRGPRQAAPDAGMTPAK